MQQMANMHVFKLIRDTQFGQELLVAGTTIGALRIESDSVDVSQLLSMIQYGQVSTESIEVEDAELIDEDVVIAPEIVAESIVETVVELLESKPESDLALLGLDEVLIESLAANNITTKAELFRFVDSGNNLVDLEKIGPTRAKKILAAIASHD